MFPPLQWDELHLKAWSWLEEAGSSKDMCNLKWNVTICDMKTKLKTTKGIHSLNLLNVQTIPNVFKNHSKMTICQ